MRIEVGIDIDRLPDVVWRAVEKIERHVDWMADAVQITFRTSRHAGVGTEFECLTRVGPFTTTDAMTVTVWEPGRVMGIEHRGVVTGAGEFTLRLLGEAGTRFSWAEELHYPWWMGGTLGELATRRVFVRIWRKNLERLKAGIERA
jgi:hypothetical protein